MGKKKEQIKIVPMSLRQVTTINKIISLYEFKFIQRYNLIDCCYLS